MIHRVEMDLGGKKLSLETGKIAKQANGAVMVQLGDTVVLVAVVGAEENTRDQDFFPLTVDYREKAYAAGRIPGGFFKREGRPTDRETLCARLTDRPIRPLFPEGFFNEVQIHIIVVSYDTLNDPDVLGIIGASAALTVSDIPFDGPIAAVRVGRVGGMLIVNPSAAERQDSDLDIIVAGNKDSIVMVEGGAWEASEADMLAALEFAHVHIKEVVALQVQFGQAAGVPKMLFEAKASDPELTAAVREFVTPRMAGPLAVAEKQARGRAMKELKKATLEAFAEKYPDQVKAILTVFEAVEYDVMRAMILDTGHRVDGRDLHTVRPITIETGILPRTHGSALFTRGETQALVVLTLGTKLDEQRIDDIEGSSFKSFMLHYNFPSYSVGEVKPIRGPGRREIGHGALAERALEKIIPQETAFPYTVRIVSDVTESNGSSSMATVCGGSLALFDAGVPVKSAVAGVAMGLIKEGDRVAILTDILGAEDHLGDMDFKVAGTTKGITAFQMDIKIGGIDIPLMGQALDDALKARLHVLGEMDKALTEPRKELSTFAPRVLQLYVPVSRIGEVIGPGGKMIRSIQEQTGATIVIEDDGRVTITAVNPDGGQRAFDIIKGMTQEAVIGQVYNGRVVRVVTFGAFIEILPGQEGLCHISELENRRVDRVEDVLNEGDRVDVKVIGIDQAGKIKVSRKACLPR